MAAFDLCSPRSQVGVRPGFEIVEPVSIKYYQREAVQKISEILEISQDDAFSLLKRFHWCGDHVLDVWYDKKIDTSIYLQSPPPNHDENATFLCGICLEDNPLTPIQNAAPTLCGHRYCIVCMTKHLSHLVKDGPTVFLDSKCPHELCKRTLGTALFTSLLSYRELREYWKFAVSSYVDDSTTLKWCPAPECKFAIALKDHLVVDVECFGLHRFCWKCKWEGHYPTECSVAQNWLSYEHDQCNKWINVHARLCPNPNCKKPIERSGGCIHMTCVCTFQFCWVCVREWTLNHGSYGDPCIPASSTSDPEDMHPISGVAAKYRRLFDLRGQICEKAITESKRLRTVNTKKAWFEIRRCLSISRWICALASYYRLDFVQFFKIQEGAQNQLEFLISLAIGEAPAPAIGIEKCTQKTRDLFEQMVAKLSWLSWENQWNDLITKNE